jgi:FAD/FMN-containing dehydrogenase
MLETTLRFRLPTFLGVIKRHRPDDFLFSHALDGFSLAMDFKVTEGNRQRLAELATALDRLVLQAGGRYYFAKDATLTPEVAAAYLGPQTLQRFFALKERWDPAEVLQPDLYRRVLRPLRATN